MKHRSRIALIVFFVSLFFVWLNNTSLFSRGSDQPILIAHRGLAPEMHPEHEDYRACLSRIHVSEHHFIENTIPSIDAAFKLGADYVEIDVRPTADARFAVFHDDVLDCKTEMTGRLIDHSMADLRGLDVGHGYHTIDGEYPLRGKGVGLMPSLEEVLNRFPQQGFVINIKSNDRSDAVRLAQRLDARGLVDSSRLLIVGGPIAVEAFQETGPAIRAVSRKSARVCIRDYLLFGWTGYVPDTCRNTVTGLYANFAWLLWGWPHRFIDRMQQVNTLFILTHPYQTDSIHALRETPAYAEMIPQGYGGAINTNRIDKMPGWLSETR